MPRPARVLPDRILAAAAAEFAACGFAGARVDRIARRARVNKAMLYYHFRSKKSLYREILRQTFSDAAERLQAVTVAGGTADSRVDRAIAVMAEVARERPFLPAIMLREIAEGGAHLDRQTLAVLSEVPRAFAAIVVYGTTTGAFRPLHPFAAYFTMFAPVVLFIAAEPIRRELAAGGLLKLPALTPDAFVRHAQECARRAFAADTPRARGRAIARAGGRAKPPAGGTTRSLTSQGRG